MPGFGAVESGRVAGGVCLTLSAGVVGLGMGDGATPGAGAVAPGVVPGVMPGAPLIAALSARIVVESTGTAPVTWRLVTS